MTLDGYALTGLFVVMFGFLAFSAWIFETHEPDPISPDRRDQAHPLHPSTEGIAARQGSPALTGLVSVPSVDVREPSGSVVPD